MERRELWIGAKAGGVTGLITGGFFVPSLVVVKTLPSFLGLPRTLSTLPPLAGGYLLVGMILLGAITMIPVVLILSLVGASLS